MRFFWFAVFGMTIAISANAAVYEPLPGMSSTAQRLQVYEAESGSVTKAGSWSLDPSGTVVWMSNGAYAYATSTVACDTVYIQFRSSDANDGYATITIDSSSPYVICTHNRSNNYVRVSDLPFSTHFVRVDASGVCDGSSGADLHLDFFGFGDVPTPTPTMSPTMTLTPTATLTPTPAPIPAFNIPGAFMLMLALSLLMRGLIRRGE